jgi:hypothetical protein
MVLGGHRAAQYDARLAARAVTKFRSAITEDDGIKAFGTGLLLLPLASGETLPEQPAVPPNPFHASGEHPERPKPGQPLPYIEAQLGAPNHDGARADGGRRVLSQLRDPQTARHATAPRHVVLLRIQPNSATSTRPTTVFSATAESKKIADSS